MMRLLNVIQPNTEEKYTLKLIGKHLIEEMVTKRELIDFHGCLIFNKDFVNKITFWLQRRKKI